jgi:CheY-like chemotaxis protein
MEPNTVLLVDDDDDVLSLMQLSLETDPSTCMLRIVRAHNGAEALALAVLERPHLIVTDLEMPVCTGGELVVQVRQNAQLRHVPILLVSGSPRLAEIAAELDVQGWLSKPFESSALCQAVRDFLQRDGPARTAPQEALAAGASRSCPRRQAPTLPTCGSGRYPSCP